MDWDQISAKWQQFKGSIKQQWGEFTDDDLDYVAGTRETSGPASAKVWSHQGGSRATGGPVVGDPEKPRRVTQTSENL